MLRQRSFIALFVFFFLALDALGLMLLSTPVSVYSAPAPTPTRRRVVRPVSPNATERHVCKTAGGDFTTIQAAVDASAPGDVIKVASGVYTESKVLVSGSITNNLYISKTVHIYGGYTCGSWATQDPAANVTTIRPTTTVISVVDIEGQIANTAAVTPTLDGFTITGGGGGNHGGGIRIRDSNALINNNIITGNLAFLLGGGIWVQRGAPHIQNNVIQNNRSDGQGQFAQGGGVQLEGSQATLIGNIIANNVVTGTTASGGGIDIGGGGPVTLTSNSILTNTATGPASAIGYGGGISIQNVTTTLTSNIVQSNTIQANTAMTTMVGYGGGVYITGTPAFTLTSNTIVSSTAGYLNNNYLFGGGIYIQSSQGLFAGNIISGNQANCAIIFGNGGGIAVLTSTLTVQGGQILNNKTAVNCEGYGGGLYARNSSLTIDSTRFDNNCAANTPFYGLGGGLAFINSPYSLTNALVTNNRSFGNDTTVGGLYADTNSPGWLINNTFAGRVSGPGQGIRTGSALTVTNSIIMSHTTGISLTAVVPISSTFNDYFANTTHNRGYSLSLSDIVINPDLDSTFHLNSGSPAIDAGTHTNAPDHDIDGQPRAMIGTSGLFKIDIGADERTGTVQRVINLDTTAPDLTIIGPGNPLENPGSNGSNDWIGYSVHANDVTGDNRADLIFAAEDWAEDFNTLNATGRLFGLTNFGTRVTGTIDLISASPNITIVGKYIRQHLGAALVTGDLNGDGKRDLIAGSYENDNDNTVPVTPTTFVFWGGSSLLGTRTITNSTPADFMVRAPAQDFFAYSAKNALTTGDLNGNGVTDLVIGDYKANDGAFIQAGAVFVIFGSGSLSALRDLAVTPADFTLYGPGTNAHLGSVAVGRINSDFQADLVARTDTTAYVILGPLSSGSRHLVSASADITVTNLQAGGLVVADITGDGKDDLILGSGSYIYVIPGPLTSGQTYNVTTAASFRITGVTASSLGIGNITGDTKLDLIIGSTSLQQTFVIPGGMNLAGAVAASDTAQMIVKASGNNYKNLGFDVSAGDLDNDGQPDLVVSTWQVNVPAHPANFQDAGKVLVFYGNGGVGAPPLSPSVYLPLIVR